MSASNLPFYWDPPREILTIPFINRPLMFYGLFFVFGLCIGYLLFLPILKQRLLKTRDQLSGENRDVDTLSAYLADRLLWFGLGGAIIGARLGHVFFYDWPRYQGHLLDIFKVWNGGLASHGGTIGILIGIFLYHRMIKIRFPQISLMFLLDNLTIPVAFCAFCIRIGNFFNQEILGTTTDLPWAVVFGHPADGSIPVPRHPAQLYEAGAYLLTFFILLTIERVYSHKLRQGVLSGLFFILVFGSRFVIEFLKVPQSMVVDESFLQIGQLLSLPFVMLGILLFVFGSKCKIIRSRF